MKFGSRVSDVSRADLHVGSYDNTAASANAADDDADNSSSKLDIRLRTVEERLEAEQHDSEMIGVFEFLETENRRGMTYYYLRLALILLLPVSLAVGFFSQQLAEASNSLDGQRSLIEARSHVSVATEAALTLSAEMWAGVRLVMEPRRPASLARFDLAVKAVAPSSVTTNVIDWRNKLNNLTRTEAFLKPQQQQQVVAALVSDYAVASDAVYLSATTVGQPVSHDELWKQLAAISYLTRYLLYMRQFYSIGYAILHGNCLAAWGDMHRFNGQAGASARGVTRYSQHLGSFLASIDTDTTTSAAALTAITQRLLLAERDGVVGDACESGGNATSAAHAADFAYLADLWLDSVHNQLSSSVNRFYSAASSDASNSGIGLAGLSIGLPLLLAVCTGIAVFYSRQLRLSRDDRVGLGELIIDKRNEMFAQQTRALDLIHMMLPKQVARVLRDGGNPEPKEFDHATVYFSSVSNFKYIVSRSRPIEIMVFLNSIYGIFDAKIEKYQVYKVETITDTYMVVSGVPVGNGLLHVTEIARMSLDLLASAKEIHIEHLPEEQMLLKIGIHTGAVVAGIMGQINPRYCLFGDTVNTASRICSHGEDLKIHVSSETAEILTAEKFYLRLRGNVSLKGKGELTTYWLLGESLPKKKANVHIMTEPEFICG